MLKRLFGRGRDTETKNADFIRSGWDRFARIPGGARLFSRWISKHVPYTGSVRPEVLELAPGFARVRMRDRPELRNHLSSLHAIALCNLAELTGNLALGYSLPQNSRFIITSIRIDYLKKARGPIVASCHCDVPKSNERRECELHVQMRDENDVLVSEARVTTLISAAPRP